MSCVALTSRGRGEVVHDDADVVHLLERHAKVY